MNTWIIFVIMLVAAYLLGSVPLSYLVARSRGIDLRKQGTQQVGGGNLWRTTSRTLGVLVGIFDFFKGAFIMYIGSLVGLDAGQQILAGMGAIIGHNWPLFLKFHGGRGVATSLGIVIFLPVINPDAITSWPLIACAAVGIGSLTIFRRTPVPVLLAVISMPIVSAAVQEPLLVTIGYVAIAVILILKRLTAQAATEKRQTSLARLLLNRFFFDRDVRYRSDWVHRNQSEKQE